jgi:GDP-mannose 6-dehydrogenase
MATPVRNPAVVSDSLSVIGLGYVGAVSAACFAAMGYRVIGVDPDTDKVRAICEGRSPLVEARLDEMIARAAGTGQLDACSSIDDAVFATDITFICVGTPDWNCNANLPAVQHSVLELGRALAKKRAYHLVVVRSTIPAGTTRNIVLPILERESGQRCGDGFGICFQPEFLREGVAVSDFFAPPKTVIGAVDKRSAEKLSALYASIDAPLIFASLEAAEMLAVSFFFARWMASRNVCMEAAGFIKN